MYLIKKVDFDTEVYEEIIGVIAGDDSDAVNWIARNNKFKNEIIKNGVRYPYLKREFIKELS